MNGLTLIMRLCMIPMNTDCRSVRRGGLIDGGNSYTGRAVFYYD